jgi:5-methylcytosine-specific restriction enzyme subunit McrC
METISVFEHQPIPLVSDDVALKGVHLRQLERLNRQAGVDLVRLGYKQLRATSYVGVIQLGGVAVQILPKVDTTLREDGNDPISVDSALANLLWMLVYAGELPVHEGEVASLLKRRADLFEILVRIFCKRLTEQMERGVHRTYQRQENTLPVLKGRWLLGRQLREQPLLRDRFLVTYDEFLADTPLNRILCYTVHFLWGLTRDAGNRRRLDILRMWFDGVTLLPRVSAQDLARVTFTRLNAAYRPVFNLACLFLAQEALQLQVGKLQAFTFLFDMNLLFERFVAGFMRRHRHQVLPEALWDCEILAQGSGAPRWLARTPDGGRKFRLKPDLLLRRQDRTISMIVDTKYKTHAAITEADAYQMHAYATRYECPEVLLLYPEGQMPDRTLYIENTIGQPPIRLRTQTINLRHNLGTRSGRDDLATELAQALEGD